MVSLFKYQCRWKRKILWLRWTFLYHFIHLASHINCFIYASFYQLWEFDVRTYVNFRRLMFKKEFDSSYVGFMRDGAKWLVENTDIKLVGKIWIDLIVYLVLPNNDTHILHCVKHLLCVTPSTMWNWYCTHSKLVPRANRTNIVLRI